MWGFRKSIFLGALYYLACVKADWGDDGDCTGVYSGECEDGFKEIYEFIEAGDTSNTKVKYCCPDDAYNKKTGKNLGSRCQVTDCVAPDVARSSRNICPGNIETRFIRGKQVEYKEYTRDHCQYDKKTLGIEALCCSPDSQDVMLTLLLGAERRQFPHFAQLHIKDKKGGFDDCGGTIYNEWYIVTASHCVMEKGKYSPIEGSYAELSVYLYSEKNPERYEMAEFIVHPNSTQRLKSSPITYNDVALIKLKTPINFREHVKALPIAKPDFDPFLYSDQAVIIGIGLTDTTETSSLLQRGNVILRGDKRNIEEGPWRRNFKMTEAPGVLFAGGSQDGKVSPVSGPGDSGGPCICRNENGYAVLCGLDSSGLDMGSCEEALYKKKSQNDIDSNCFPEAYMEVAHYHDWIVSVAGKQKDEQLGWFPLYGTAVQPGKYQHQVHITSGNGLKNGDKCGGTLIRKDVVLTAANCVADDNGNIKDGLKVTARFQDLNFEEKQATYGVKKIKVADGFQKGQGGMRRRRIAKLNTMPTPPQSPYYSNNLALVKLDRRVRIKSRRLPKIGEATLSHSDNVKWATEVSFPLDKSRSGKLQQRDFRLLSHRSCQSRMDRAQYAGYNVTVDENLMCGEERYNGGSQCDRELGGGLFCGTEGDEDRDVLCGLQIFRFCQLALPTGYLNLESFKRWIEKEVDSL